MNKKGFSFAAFFILIILFWWSPEPVWQIRPWGGWASHSPDELRVLRIENDFLKAEMQERVSYAIPFPQADYLPAYVYSRYPYNFKNELVLSRGFTEEVAAGAAVLIPVQASGTTAFVFVGGVSTSSARVSYVRTIYDYRLQLPVRVGPKNISGLLQGGLEPVVTLIPKDAVIKKGEVILSAAAGYPYGLVIGRVKVARLSPDKLFQEAEIEFTYDLNQTTLVFVQKKI